jgi:nucleotide-binding universal stress UspA family protein
MSRPQAPSPEGDIGGQQTFACLLVYVEADTVDDHRIRLAASLSERFGSTLIGFSALANAPPMVTDGVVVEEMRNKLAQQGHWFRGIAGRERDKLEWRTALGLPAEALAREASCADLVIVGQAKPPINTYRSLDPGQAVLKLGRPALVVPRAISSLQADRVVIGWKDTREARRAVRDAIPFLQRATRVTIVEACPLGKDSAALKRLDDVARYLSYHRIEMESRVMLEQRGSGAEQLIRIAREDGADLLVTGAYGHSRLGEWMFGGMTWELLATSSICCLMSH